MTSEPAERCPSCDLVHEVAIEQVVVGRDAREQLGRYLDGKRWRSLLLVMDTNTADAVGDDLGAELSAAGHRVEAHTFRARTGLLADEEAVGAVRDRLGAREPDGVIAVGSGVINDVTRYASFLDGSAYVCVPTAPSMDGYASTVAAMQFDGVKVTLPTHGPLAIFADLATLVAAPREMIVWGLGDLLGKATAHVDWLLGSAAGGEAYCELVAARVREPLERCVRDVEALVAAGEDAVRDLTTGLIDSGIAMAMMGSSRPASGCEHHASHFWDLLAFRGRREHAPHGLQVGYATRFATAVQARALTVLGDPLLSAAGGGDASEEREWFGEQQLALAPVRDEKQVWFAEHGDHWPPPPAELGTLVGRLEESVAGFGALSRALDVAGIPADTGFLGIDRAVARATLRYANRLRSRFTVLDLLESQHHLESVIDDVVPI